VIVVPRQHAERVAEIARQIANDDKRGRRSKYEKAGLPADDTLEALS
jgi:hypothetical protein